VPSEEKVYLSLDTLTTTGCNREELDLQYPTEFLNGLSFSGMIEHELRFKPYVTVVILWNLNPSAVLCNGTSILLTHFANNVVRGLIIGGTFEGTVVVIPHCQYLLGLRYEIPINKSQDQTLEQVLLYLPNPIFSHGQLYVVISRVCSTDGIHVVIKNDETLETNITRNIVYDEIFEDMTHL
ncbi:hypothetical protein LINPERPRIM_LOCUS31725, partial [Linum perenne]